MRIAWSEAEKDRRASEWIHDGKQRGHDEQRAGQHPRNVDGDRVPHSHQDRTIGQFVFAKHLERCYFLKEAVPCLTSPRRFNRWTLPPAPMLVREFARAWRNPAKDWDVTPTNSSLNSKPPTAYRIKDTAPRRTRSCGCLPKD